MAQRYGLVLLSALALATASASAQSVVAPVTQDPLVASLQQRVDALESQLRLKTGENERLQRERDLARADVQRLEKLVNDLLAEQAARAAEPTPAPVAPPPPPRKSPPPAAVQPPPVAATPPPAAEAVPLPAGDPAAAYRTVRTQLMRGDNAGAEQGLRQWIAQYGNDPLAPEAKFWLGQTLLGRSANDEAAKVFVDLLRTHPTAPIAPEAMTRLGVALTRMGEKAKGCTAFADVARRFPTAAPAVKARAAEEARKATCPAG